MSLNLNEVLEPRYVAALEAADPSLFAELGSNRPLTSEGQKTAGLSDIFFPTVAPGFEVAPLRVMVMGRETRGWSYPPLPEGSNPRTAAEYVAVGMARHRDFRDSKRCLDGKASDSGLVRLLKNVSKVTNRPGLIYSNLFAVDHKRGDPRNNSTAWPHVRALSKALLDLQIEVLRPDLIVFANGIDSADVRREFFPHHHPTKNPSAFRCSGSDNWEVLDIGIGHLWGFWLDERIRCYRVHHPSAWWRTGAKATAAGEKLLQLLRDHAACARPSIGQSPPELVVRN